MGKGRLGSKGFKVLRKTLKSSKKRSLFLVALLFILSAAISPAIAKLPASNFVVESPQNAQQQASKAIQLYREGKFIEAAAAWKLTANVFLAQGDRLNQAMALSNLSLTYQQLGQWEQASSAIAQSLQILKTQPENKEKLQIQAQTLDVFGSLQREIGQSANALNTWQEAANIYGKINQPLKVAQSKINQTQAMQDLGLYPRACKTLLEVLNKQIEGVKSCQELGQLSKDKLTQKLKKVENESPSLTVAVGLRSLGELLRLVSQPEQSEIILATSLNLAEKLNSPQDIAATYLSIGNTAREIAEREPFRSRRENYEEKAASAYGEVIKLSPSPMIRQQAQLNQLSLLLKLGQVSATEELWRSLNSQLTTLSPSRTGVYQQINFAQSFINSAQTKKLTLVGANPQLPTFNDIDKILARATEQARSLGDKRAEAYALGNRGGLYELTEATPQTQAEKFTQQSLSIVSNFEAPDIAYQFFWQLGRIRKSQGDIEDAIAAYTKAYDALGSLRGDLVGNNAELQFSFRDRVEPIYRELVDLDLQYVASLNKEVKNEKRQSLLIQARDVIESLQVAELNNFFREACVEANTKQIDRVDKKAAVIYPIILGDRLEVILSLPNQPLSVHTKQISQQDFEQTVQDVQGSLKTPDSIIEGFLPEYKQLYDWLIQPLENELATSKVSNLVFVLNGKLRNIPMSILYDGKNYLIEKYPIAISSGLQLIEPKPLAEIKLRALTAGLSEVGKEFTGQFKPLIYVEEELKQIKNSGIPSQPILNAQFTTKEFKKEIGGAGFPIVHLATHGQFSSKAEDTFILAWDSRINVIDFGNLLRNSTLNQGRPIELLVLSACETASGDERAALGLAGVAVRAGARSTLATLWSVEDKSTAKIMGELYHQLEQAKEKKINRAQVLQYSQLSLLKDLKDTKYNHPHYWAPFVLVGNWQ
ncbi:CHAT domain-containing protein [Plectonema radiosum NIES-515]|uniref:CHAT domain-containing protein n=1 Tax=Plectonema radiosum NIES-515 TaxID=2986073 RepID=A0ABT3AU66_9CYAN|nr:CHAT domain-containing protein [Plectonema radiosum]MCV3212667.1 CHAT domain-containing protein [Plectonema radiosum NIES-515]